MKAMVRERFGPPEVLEMREVEQPRIGADDVLVRVHASTVSIGDWFWLTGTPRIMRPVSGLLRPRDPILGRDVAGTVEAIGANVTDLAVGDEVFGEVPNGAHAEFVAAPAKLLTVRPANLTFEEAAAAPLAGVTALQGLRDAGGVRDGSRVLVNGASGAVGTFAVQIAKALGATVTGVASTRNLELVRSLGADHVIDYTTTDFTAGTKRYDVIFDLAGSHGIGDCRRVLAPGGTYVASTSKLGVLLRASLRAPFSGGRVKVFAAKGSRSDLEHLRNLIEAGKVRPVIDGRYPLERTADAFRAQGAGHAQGRKVITVTA
jgi:NADPH:quinone reductase-like Zn-dependent oxidoreductase